MDAGITIDRTYHYALEHEGCVELFLIYREFYKTSKVKWNFAKSGFFPPAVSSQNTVN